MMKYRFGVLFLVLIFLGTGCSSTPKRANHKGTKPDTSKSVSSPVQDATQEISTANPLVAPVLIPEATTPGSLSASERIKLSSAERESLVNSFLEGVILEERHQFDDAGKAYSKALQIVPESSYIGASTSRAMLQSGQLDDAIRLAQDAIVNGTGEVEAYHVLGLAYEKKNDLDQAISQYQKILVLSPHDLEAMNQLVTLYIRSDRYEEAIGIYRNMANIDVAQAFLYQYRIALILTQLGRFEEAIQEYQTVAKEVPKNFDVYFRIGKLYEAQGKNDPAIETYLTALQNIRNSQDELSVRESLAALYQNRKSYREAIYQYKRVQELAENDPETAFHLASIYYEQENYPETLKSLDPLIQKSPGDFYYQYLRRQTLEKLQRNAEGYTEFLKGFGHAIDQRDWENAQRYLVELTRKDTVSHVDQYKLRQQADSRLTLCRAGFPNQPRVLFAIAEIARLRNDNAALTVHLNEILAELDKSRTEKDPVLLPRIGAELRSWFQVRLAFFPHHLNGALTDSLKACVQESSNDPELIRTLAYVYMDAEDWTSAESWLAQAKNRMDINQLAYKDLLFQMAIVYDKLSRLADLETVMKEAMKLYPEDSQPYNYLGYTFAERNMRLDEALTLIQKALRLSPDDGNVLDSLGWVYFRMGQTKEAIQYLEKAITLEADHPVILDHLGDAYHQKGEEDKALRYWKMALENGPDYPYEFTAEFLEKLNQKILKSQEKPLQ